MRVEQQTNGSAAQKPLIYNSTLYEWYLTIFLSMNETKIVTWLKVILKFHSFLKWNEKTSFVNFWNANKLITILKFYQEHCSTFQRYVLLWLYNICAMCCTPSWLNILFCLFSSCFWLMYILKEIKVFFIVCYVLWTYRKDQDRRKLV